MKNLTYFIFILIPFFLLSCSSKKLIVEPFSESTFFEQGRQYVNHSDGKIEVNICHERTDGRNMVFYIEVVNKDTAIVEVNPASFYYTHTFTSSDTTYEKPNYRIPAKNPEDEIKRIDKIIQDEKDSYAAGAIVNGVVALAGAVAGIINLFSGDDEEEEYEKEEEESDYDPAEARYKHEQKIGELESERYYWENDALRRTRLLKDNHCGGFVEFAVSRDIKMITIHIPVGESDLCCRFSQKWVTL
jgi:hypothetical protein